MLFRSMEGAVASEEAVDESGPAILEEAGENALELARSFRRLEAADIAVFEDFISALRLPRQGEDRKSVV